MRLVDIVKLLECDIISYRWTAYKCECEDPELAELQCCFGDCLVTMCAHCGRYVAVSVGRCFAETMWRINDLISSMIQREKKRGDGP